MADRLVFQKYVPGRDPWILDAVKYVEETYLTQGKCTHVAYTQLGETALAFPLKNGERFLAFVSEYPANSIEAKMFGRFSVDEWNVDFTDEQLEEGIPVSASLY